MIAALYVETNGVYFDRPNVDPWDVTRDAKLYDGPHAVVAHPPCGPWGALKHLSRKQDPTWVPSDDEPPDVRNLPGSDGQSVPGTDIRTDRVRCTNCLNWFAVSHSSGRRNCFKCSPAREHRKHEPAKVGDVFGCREVATLLPRDATSNERVLARCECGHKAPAYVFNLRATKRCAKCGRHGRPAARRVA